MLERVRTDTPFELDEIDITGDADLERRYRERLPVVVIDGEEVVHVLRVSRRPASSPDRLGRLQSLYRTRSVLSPGAVGQWLCSDASMAVELATEGTKVGDRLTVGVAARLSQYLRVLTQAKKMGQDKISSQEISEYTNINATQIRRDLSAFGKFGKRGVGYNIEALVAEIRKILRTQGQHNIGLFGAGRLGQAIASSTIFADHGFNIAAAFDVDRDKVGQPIGDTVISDYSQLRSFVREKNIIVAVLAVPPDAAQQVADDVVEAGVKIIFNYTEALLHVPSDVTVHTTSPAVELLYALYFYLT